jgi:hypothetical protein
MNKDTDWFFFEDESIIKSTGFSITCVQDCSKQNWYVLLDQKDEDVFIYEALDGDDNPVTYECWAILMSEHSFYGKQARSETAKVIKVSDRNMNSLQLLGSSNFLFFPYNRMHHSKECISRLWVWQLKVLTN